MATSRYSYWLEEMSPHHRGPTAGGMLRLAVLAVLVALALQLLPATDSGGQATRPTTPPPCAQHFPPTCRAVSRGR
jgi:hypothetical protein